MTYPWKGAARPLPPQSMEDAARGIGCDAAALQAVWEVEAAGRYWLSDGSLIRRFEPHHMPGSKMGWRDSLRIGAKQREELFLAAYAEQPDAALRATSWGATQIMGFNAREAGFSSAREMVEACADDAQAQVRAFVGLVEAWGLDSALRGHDWYAFARRWNGSGQPHVYARKMESAYRRHSGGHRSPKVLRVGSRGEPVKRLQRALGIEDDGAFGPRTKEAVEAYQRDAGLAVDGVAGQKTWDALKAQTQQETVRPVSMSSRGEAVANRVAAVSGTVGTATAALGGVNRVIPPDALPVIYIVAAVAVAVAGVIYAWRKLR